MKKLYTSTFLLISSLCLFPAKAQEVAVKTNALYWATTSTNLSAEVSVAPKWSVELMGAYNPWTFKDDKKMKFWLLQPEGKYWFCEAFEGHFVGIHAHGAQFFGGFGSKRYDGWLVGGGVSYGYDWILGPHWNLEAEIGIGYAHLWYDQSDRIPCLKDKTHKHKNYVGPTRAAVTFSYIF